LISFTAPTVGVALGTGELPMVGTLVALGCFLAAIPGTVSYRRPVAEGLRE
jgi:hypothetical protein